MTIYSPNKMPVFSNYAFENDSIWFQKLLDKYGVNVVSGSILDIDLKALVLLSKWYRKEADLPLSVNETTIKRALGLDFIIKAVFNALQTESSKEIINKLPLFKGYDILLLDGIERTEERDLMWELLIGCLSSQFCRDLSFGTPDVCFQFQDISFGNECKSFYTSSVDRQRDAIIKGVKQIEESSVDYGVVSVNLSYLLDTKKYIHKKSENLFSSFQNKEEPLKHIKDDIEQIIKALDTHSLYERLLEDKAIKKERNKTRGIIYFAQTACFINNIPVALTNLSWYHFRRIVSMEVDYFKQLNSYGEKTLSNTYIDLNDS